MTTALRSEEAISSAKPLGRDYLIQGVVSPLLPQFDRLVQSYALFNLIFISVGFIEFTLLVIFFTFLAKSAILALSLAVVFLTFFSYFILRLYFQTQKPVQFRELKDRYLQACKGVMGHREGSPEQFAALANACNRLSENLKGREHSYYRMPSQLSFLDKYIAKFSFWTHWSDVHSMRELLLLSAIEENIKCVKDNPMSEETHSVLAESYLTLSTIYINLPDQEEEGDWLSNPPVLPALEQKFTFAIKRAMEELKILSDFSPQDPWVHARLARCYHDLKMPQNEIAELEIILELVPDDTETMLKLGTLYFEQGLNARGLCMYEQLRDVDHNKAELLIQSYGIS